MVIKLPNVSKDVLFWRLHFSLGPMSHAMHMTGRFQLAPDGVPHETDAEALAAMLLTSVTAGMEAPL